MKSREVQLKPGQYTSIVHDHDKPYVVIKTDNGKLVHKDYETSSEALNASKSGTAFPGDLLCVYNLTSQTFVINEIVHDRWLAGRVNDIVAYHLNK